MAKLNPAGCGWVLAALFAIGLVSRCGSDDLAGSNPGVADPIITASEWVYVQPATANCRSAPSTRSASLERLSRNNHVGVLAKEGGWSLLDRSTDCWIRNDLIRNQLAAEPAPIRSLMGPGQGDSIGVRPRRNARSAYYANCSAARAAGAAPVYAGEPGYARRLDRDGDGVGCE